MRRTTLSTKQQINTKKIISPTSVISVFSQHDNWLEVKNILLTLNKERKIAYLAGGCVRDALLGRIPKDFDIATSLRAEEVLKLFPGSNKQGKAFGVVAVFCSKGPVEVATFRKDGPYVDGRHPQYVEFLSDKEDALRRDFTVNALFYDLKTNKVIDYVGGMEDLKRKIVRTVGDPEQRFQEDHLRILRALRFSLKLNFEIEQQTKKTLFKMKNTLLKISRERVYEECLKILKEGQFKKAFVAFKELNLLNHFLFPLTVVRPSKEGVKTAPSTCLFPLKESHWEFCLKFWNQPVFSKLMSKKSFLWMYGFFPILIQGEAEVFKDKTSLSDSKNQSGDKKARGPIPQVSGEALLPSRSALRQRDSNKTVLKNSGQWKKSFNKNLKEWKFPVSLIKELNEIFYSACCILGFKTVSLGKKLRMLNSDSDQSILFLCRNYLKHTNIEKGINIVESEEAIANTIDKIDNLEKEFMLRAPNGKLPKPLINGNDLKALGVPEDKNMARLLENLYAQQIEDNITEKAFLLKNLEQKEKL